ncbi:ABC transporter ATP-binding protein [Pseudonocardia spinosispora]|uniref:ABC transporter ATP-binding protein n=1 Tax=Pseudonocardia spinosispora TaxID=103441 RepID=UPI000424AB43|nr:ABC transporter ATP-binding protein [Pseudonocardia spinosispora]
MTRPMTEHLPGATETARPPAVRFDGVGADYGNTRALRDFTVDIPAGETLALLGPSGSGKSTALKVLAGFLRPVAGRVLVDGADVTDLPPARRGLGVVVQSYALFPHMRVADNVAFGLRARRLPRAEVGARVTEVLDLVGMRDFASRYPSQLSGGQQQRIAIARALAIRPPVLLLDEPLSALDVHLRHGMLTELQRLRDELPDIAILYVTHDQVEALTLADRIGVMRDGALVDVDDTRRLWEHPPSRFTAAFLGGANLLPSVVLAGRHPGGVRVRVGEVEIVAAGDGLPPGSSALLAVRPHAIRVTSTSFGPDVLPATVKTVQWRGPDSRLSLAVDALPDLLVEVDQPGATRHAVGDRIGVHVPDGAGVLVSEDS